MTVGGERTREIVRDFFAKLPRQHRVDFSMCGLRQFRLRHCSDHDYEEVDAVIVYSKGR